MDQPPHRRSLARTGHTVRDVAAELTAALGDVPPAAKSS